MPEFKYKVGDFVCIRAQVQTVIMNMRGHVCVMQILERIYQECPGGIQLHYSCLAASSTCETIRFLEHTIMPAHDASEALADFADLADDIAKAKESK